MFLFDLLFGKKKSGPSSAAGNVAVAQSAPVVSAPGTQIHHDPHLIEALKQDHRLLLEIFAAIDNARQHGDLIAVQTRLNQFRIVIQDHLLKENVRLYVFLEHLLVDDPASHELMHGFRHEMDGIGRAVVGFLTRYKEIGLHPELAAAFATDLAAIGEALAARIHREEQTLYPMYAPPA